jgi:N-acetylglucosaminyldiphosphoundecaprenol N-acetyl-beta-D-mannosaminyltransferase
VARGAQLDSFFVGGVSEASTAIVERALSGDGGYVCLANAHVVATARRDAGLEQALRAAWLVLPDGWPVAWLQRRLGAADARRVPGPDLMPLVFAHGEDVGLRHFLLGSSESVLDSLESELRARFPRAEIVGSFSPRFSDCEADEPAALAAIAGVRPHVVWCALGAPKQEKWMRANATRVGSALIVGVGAAFDFISGSKARAPRWMQRLGLEWLHRLVSEPRRLARRYVVTNLEFIALAAGGLWAARRVP